VPKNSYELPDGQIIAGETISAALFRCPEALFDPSLVGRAGFPGLPGLVDASVSACDEDLWAGLFRNVVLSGGTSMFPGIADRLQKELTPIFERHAASLSPLSLSARGVGLRLKVLAPPERNYSAWIGSSILASTAFFQVLCFA
jgi:actin-related protein